MLNFVQILTEDWRSNGGTGFINQLFLLNYRLGRAALYGRKKFGLLLFPIYVPLALIARVLSVLVGCSVPFSATLGRRIRFQHGLHGVFISGLAKIGDDCLILHQVTIGSNIGGRRRQLAAPRIGNRVFIGVGAKIIGDLVIGNDATVGAQALIVNSIPAGARCRAPEAEIREASSAQ